MRTYEIVQEESPESPREWDNVGTMICWHRNYTLGDEQPDMTPDEFKDKLVSQHTNSISNWVDLAYPDADDDDPEAVEFNDRLVSEWLEQNTVMLPLYLYDHSGITMRTSSFSCNWDSGQVGFIYCTKEKAMKELGCSENEWRERATDCLEGEVETYDQYLTGDVYGYIIKDEQGEEEESCWGFFGYDYCEQEAKAICDWRDSSGNAEVSKEAQDAEPAEA